MVASSVHEGEHGLAQREIGAIWPLKASLGIGHNAWDVDAARAPGMDVVAVADFIGILGISASTGMRLPYVLAIRF